MAERASGRHFDPTLAAVFAREQKALLAAIEDPPNKEIGKVLGISPLIVQIHVGHRYDKLGVYSRAGAAIWLIENDLVH